MAKNVQIPPKSIITYEIPSDANLSAVKLVRTPGDIIWRRKAYVKEGVVDAEHCNVYLVNTTNKPVTLYKGSTIGIFEDIQEHSEDVNTVR